MKSMKRICATLFVGILTVGTVRAASEQPAATAAQRAAQDEIARRQEAQTVAIALIDQGAQLLRQEKFEEAVAKLEQGLKVLPRAKVTEIDYDRGSRFLGEAYYRLADAALQQGNQAKAEEWAAKSLKADPSNRSAATVLRTARQPKAAQASEPRLDATPEFERQKTQVKKLFREGQILLNSGQYDEAEKRFKQVLLIDRYNDDAYAQLLQLNKIRLDIANAGGQAVRNQRLWEVADAWVPAIRQESATIEKEAKTSVINASGTQTTAIMQKLSEIIIPEINFRDAVIADVVNFLSQESRRLDPQKIGVNILLGAGVESPATPVPAAPVVPAVPAAPEVAAPAAPAAVPGTGGERRITLSLHNVPLIDALKYTTSLAGLKYRIEASAVLILPMDAVEGEMITRSYPVSATAIKTVVTTAPTAGAAPATAPTGVETYRAFGGGGGVSITSGGGDVKAFFTDAGVPFPPGTSIVYNDRTSILIVRNTPANLEIFERVLASIDVIPKQVEIEAKFVDVSQTALDELGFHWTVGAWQFGGYNSDAGRREFQLNDGATSNLRDSATIQASALDALLAGGGSGAANNVLGSLSGILSSPSVQLVIKALAQRTDTDLLSAPKVTTISGQQAQIKVVQEFIYPSSYREPTVAAGGGGVVGGNGGAAIMGSIPQDFKTREVGVLLNCTPTVGADGNTINLTLVPEVSEFLGFLDYSSVGQLSGSDQVITNTIKQPLFSSRNLTTSIIIWDGQTVVLGGLLREDVKAINDKVPFLGDIPWLGRLFQSKTTSRTKRNLLIFVNARLVDPAGNPIHRTSQKVGL